jgi:hypothetical protein
MVGAGESSIETPTPRVGLARGKRPWRQFGIGARPTSGDPTMQPRRNTLSESVRAQSAGLLDRHSAAAIGRIGIWVNEGGCEAEVKR